MTNRPKPGARQTCDPRATAGIEDDPLTLIADLQARVEKLESERHADGPVFDIDALRARGYSQHQGYSILRAYGVKRAGRLRITREQLSKYENMQIQDHGEDQP